MRGRRRKGRSGKKSGRERMGGGKRRGRGEDEEEWEEKDWKQKLEHISKMRWGREEKGRTKRKRR